MINNLKKVRENPTAETSHSVNASECVPITSEMDACHALVGYRLGNLDKGGGNLSLGVVATGRGWGALYQYMIQLRIALIQIDSCVIQSMSTL